MVSEPFFSILLAVLASIFWGVNAHLVKFGMRDENTFYALFARSLFTYPILFTAVLIWKGLSGLLIYLEPRLFAFTIISASLVLLGDYLFLLSLKKYTVNVMSPLTSIYPLFTTFILILTGTEVVGVFILMGTVLIIFGVAAVTSGDLSHTYEFRALIFGMLTAGCWGTSIYFVRLILDNPSTDALGLTGIRIFMIGTLSLIIFHLNPKNRNERSQRSQKSKLDALKYMAASGIVGWVIGASLFFYAVQRIGASIPTPISSTNPIVASIIGFIFGYESLSLKQLAGIILCILGIVIIILTT